MHFLFLYFGFFWGGIWDSGKKSPQEIAGNNTGGRASSHHKTCSKIPMVTKREFLEMEVTMTEREIQSNAKGWLSTYMPLAVLGAPEQPSMP